MQQLVDAAIANYLSWQQFLGSIATGGNSDELSRKFNHLLAETQQAQADLRQLIKEANDRISQQAIWTSREIDKMAQFLAQTNGQVEAIKKGLSSTGKNFSDSEIEVLRRFARSMGAASESQFTPLFAPAESAETPIAECTDFCQASKPAIDPKTDEGIEAAKIVELVEGSEVDRLQNLNRQQLGKLLTQYGIPHRNPEGRVWRVDEMRSMLAEKMPTTEITSISTETKRRGRPRKAA